MSGANDPIHVISLGAGVQSSTMALMAAVGEITPMPTAAIFADTGDEPASVYRYLRWLELQLPFPVFRVSHGVISEDSLIIKRSKKKGRLYSNPLVPAFMLNPDGSKGILGRKCTADYKLKPINKKVRELANIGRGVRTVKAIQWVGVSVDEAIRMKPSRVPWSKTRWPLIEKRMSRNDCLSWMRDNGHHEPPRSACVFCPFHSDHEWRRLKEEEPDEWRKAVQFEKSLTVAVARSDSATSIPFLNKRCVPLDQIDFYEDSSDPDQMDLFGNECEGLCGV